MEQFIYHEAAVKQSDAVYTLREKIAYRNITFAYEGQAPVLSNFDFIMEKGKRYLLKGPSGCGKTTAVNLLLKYFDAYDGAIEIDGRDLRGLGGTYGLITVVRQEAVLFNDTLRNNLTMYGDIPDGKLTGILETLGLNKFANGDALNETVAEHGANLSGGEKKRICLARALLRNTDVLILDEPLANLDADTVNRIEDLLLSVKDRTLLVVSHQFSEGKLGAFDRVLDLNKIYFTSSLL
jgi:ABC-type multidrug transport system fused ATPase/permease subunit